MSRKSESWALGRKLSFATMNKIRGASSKVSSEVRSVTVSAICCSVSLPIKVFHIYLIYNYSSLSPEADGAGPAGRARADSALRQEGHRSQLTRCAQARPHAHARSCSLVACVPTAVPHTGLIYPERAAAAYS
jgi:hypothetical protein